MNDVPAIIDTRLDKVLDNKFIKIKKIVEKQMTHGKYDLLSVSFDLSIWIENDDNTYAKLWQEIMSTKLKKHFSDIDIEYGDYRNSYKNPCAVKNVHLRDSFAYFKPRLRLRSGSRFDGAVYTFRQSFFIAVKILSK